mmetsp:Transcript_102029/g.297596  ORF Transcript_102029/g.297596 Transcript_102029/m.297596 type:complete len:223 (+) Transcript_102029:431-1099(+)
MVTFCFISRFQPRFRMMRCTSEMSSPSASAILSASRPLSAKLSTIRCVFSPMAPGSALAASAHCRTSQELPRPTLSSTSAGWPSSGGSWPPKRSQIRTATAPPWWSGTGGAVEVMPASCLVTMDWELALAAGASGCSEFWFDTTVSTSCRSTERLYITAFRWTCPHVFPVGSCMSNQRPSSCSPSDAATSDATLSFPAFPKSVLRPVKSMSRTPAVMCCRSS